jgi:endonuclease/exonuclease/phosphatase family metal-dependent hydrolase
MTAPAIRADDEPTVIGVGYQNLREGGIDGDDDARLQQMVDRLADADLDAVLLGEAMWRDRGDRQLHQIAQRLGASFRCRVRSNYYRCDMAVFIREDKLRVAEERHENGSMKPWFHGLGRVETRVPGFGRLDIAVAHFAPSMPKWRVLEAEAFHLLGKAPMIAAGDFNAVAVNDPAAPETFGPDKEHKLRDEPAQTIASAGFRDAGAVYGDLSPTVGIEDDKPAYRCDRLYCNVPGAQVADFTVLPPFSSGPGRMRLSDHAAVIARFILPTIPGSTDPSVSRGGR